MFTEKWTKCSINLRYALARRKEAFKCAKGAFSVNGEFGDSRSAWELVNHEKWQSVLRPRIMQHGISFQKLNRRTKSRREGREGSTQEEDRRVKQRLDVNGPQPVAEQNALTEEIELKKVVAQGIQLEFDIMTQSEDGLSAEAIAYLHLRRLQILQKLRAQIGRQQWL